MASFTDQLPTFNPFVPTMPVDAMVQVGMQKQQKYEENVQKIQTQIDNVAGMEVLRPEDKQYLQSKLNELGNNLSSVAAGDFSNFQLVNSVSGMTGQIVKDPFIQAAVSSAATHKKNRDFMDEERKKGTLTPDNELDYSKQLSAYLNSGLKGPDGKPVVFSGQYVPHVDVFKKLGEIAKSVGEDSTIVQQLFITDSNGNPVLKNGQLQYNDVMAETLLKGKDKNKILSAFQNGLDANDYRQLSITGKYEMRGRSPEDISKMLEDGFMDFQKTSLLRKDAIQDKILELKTKGGSQQEIDALQEAAANIDLSISKRKESIQQTVDSGDVDAVRGSLYTNNYLDSMSGAFSSKDTYKKYLKNPAVEAMMDRERLKLQQNEFKLNQDKFRYQQNRDVESDKLEIWKAKFAKGLVDENGNPTGAGLYSGAFQKRPLSDITNTSYFNDQFKQGVTDDMNAQFELYKKVAIADWMAKNSGKVNPITGKAFTTDEIRDQMKAWATKVGMTENDYIVLQGQKATDKYNQRKGSLGAEYTDAFNTINELGTRIGITKKKIDNEASAILAEAKKLGFAPVDLTKIDIKPVTVTAVIGGEAEGMGKMRRQNVTLSKQDVFDFAKFINHDWEGGFVPGAFDSELVKDQAKEAKDRLIKKYGTAGFESIQKSLRGREKFDPADLNPFNVVFNPGLGDIKQNPEIKKAINVLKNDNFSKTMALREQYYKGMSEVATPGKVILYGDKAEEREHLQSALASITSDYRGIDASYEDLTKAALDDKSKFQINIDPATSRYGNNTYELQVTKSDGTIIAKPITEDHFQSLTGKPGPSIFVDDIKVAITNSPYGSTNLGHMYTDPDAYSTAFVKGNQTRAKNYNVAMDYVIGSNGNYFPKLYVQMGEDNWKLLPYNGGKTAEDAIGITAQQAKSFPLQVDDLFIKSLLQSR